MEGGGHVWGRVVVGFIGGRAAILIFEIQIYGLRISLVAISEIRHCRSSTN